MKTALIALLAIGVAGAASAQNAQMPAGPSNPPPGTSYSGTQNPNLPPSSTGTRSGRPVWAPYWKYRG